MRTPTPLPSFWSRLSLAFGTFFKTVGDAEFAARVRDDGLGPVSAPPAAGAPGTASGTASGTTSAAEPIAAPAAAPAAVPAAAPAAAPVAAPAPAPAPIAAPAPPPAPVLLHANTPDAALQLLALLQREARLIDFVHENLAAYSDAEIGAAARVVHEGCARVLETHFTITPVRAEAEGARLTLEAGFDTASVRLGGNVVGQAPFTGTLSHRGWRATDVRLPQLASGHDAQVLAPAEVEL